MAILDKEAILKADDSELTEIEIPEWGGTLFVGPMRVSERLAFDSKHCDENGQFKDLKDPELIYDLLSLSIRTEHGLRMFDEKGIRDLDQKNAKVIHSLFYKCLNANYAKPEAVEMIKKK